VHAGVDEVTFVLAGEITAETGGEVVADAEAVAATREQDPEGVMGRMRAPAERYGVQHHPELVEDLKRRHGLG